MRLARLLALTGLLAGCPAQPAIQTSGRPLSHPPEAVDLDPSPDRLEVRLVAERAADGTYSYSGGRPGPTLRARVGDGVTIHLDNRLDVPTTVHWHGVGVPNDMDGVPWVTGTVAPGESFTYAFTVQRAGTFWYHPHFDTARQVDLGLYGLFVVEDPSEPDLPELLLVFDEPDEGAPDARHGHGRLAPRWILNGEPTPVIHRLSGATRVRARILNASNTGYLWLHGQDMGWAKLAGDQGLDGGGLEPDPVLLAPGDRVELELKLEDNSTLVSRAWSLNGGPVGWMAPIELVRFEVDTPGSAPPQPNWPHTPARAPTRDPGRTDIVWTFAGSDRSGRWTIDGEIFPEVTAEHLAIGQTAVVEIRNMSPTEHPFHLHGFPFEILSIDDLPPAAQTFEDTVNVRIRERVRLLVTPDRVGTWMAHCHILPHADGGMMTLLEVEE